MNFGGHLLNNLIMSVICVYTISEMENFKSHDVEVLLPVGRNRPLLARGFRYIACCVTDIFATGTNLHRT